LLLAVLPTSWVSTEDGPIVLPMAYGVSDTESGGESRFHNSMNYRSVVVRGTATAIIEPVDKLVALEAITDHIAPMWGTARPPSEIDVKKTLVLSLPLTKASAKVRCGGPMTMMTMMMMMMMMMMMTTMTWTARTGLVPFH
jgi:nitroimidazol reductase NimA-like FMN-containing flavoprotein (pyridoxamine 5'-phosphate oxidase superfamily)